MPTFSAIALERLIEPGAYKIVDKSYSASEYPPLPKHKRVLENVSTNMERKSNASGLERKLSRPQLTPALYATPEPTPLPDSPSSFSPSPYIVNFKRRGPRIVTSSSQVDSESNNKVEKVVPNNIEELHMNGSHLLPCANEAHHGNEVESCYQSNGVAKEEPDDSTGAMLDAEKDGEEDDFFDPQESMSCASNTDVEDNLYGSVSKIPGSARTSEFYDAWDDISSESSQTPSLFRNFEAELSEIKLNLLVEVERRKQAEEALSTALDHWQKMRERLSLVGISLPVYPSLDDEIGAEVIQQLDVARFVANSVGRGAAMAEMEIEMESKLETKNCEISRLMDRLQYYEAMNREMSQRNQEVVEVARRNRLLRKRKQRWMWGGMAAAITVGSAALAWSYVGPTIGSSWFSSFSSVPSQDNSSVTH